MDILSALRNLGLTDKEAKVYLALLQLGKSSAYVIADKAGLKKPTTYVILGELIEKGLVSQVPRVRKKLYVPKPPEEIFALAEERIMVARQVLPELKSLARAHTGKVQSLYFEGEKGLQQALWYRLKEMKGKELVGFYASGHDSPSEIIHLAYEWGDRMKQQGITVRGIAPEHPSLKAFRGRDKAHGRTMKIVPFEKYSANISIDVGDTFVRIVALRDAQATIIDNPDVARTTKQIFEMVWESLPEAK